MSLVWNFCACFADAILWGNQYCNIEKCFLRLHHTLHQRHYFILYIHYANQCLTVLQDRIEEDRSDRRRTTSSRGSDLGSSYGSGHGGSSLALGGSGGGGGPLGNIGGLLGLGFGNFAQGINYKTDPLSCTVFVSNVS